MPEAKDELLKASWDEAWTYAAKGIIHITKKYSGEEGAKKLIEQGYPKEMVDPMKGRRYTYFQRSWWYGGLRYYW